MSDAWSECWWKYDDHLDILLCSKCRRRVRRARATAQGWVCRSCNEPPARVGYYWLGHPRRRVQMVTGPDGSLLRADWAAADRRREYDSPRIWAEPAAIYSPAPFREPLP